MSTGVTAVEQSRANGRAEQRVRALRERLQIMVEDARRGGAEIILDHPVVRWAVRRVEWIRNFLVQGDVDLSGGGTIKITPHEAHTGDKAQSNVAAFWERILVRNKINDDKQPRFLVGWSHGHKDADVITLMEDGSVEIQSRRAKCCKRPRTSECTREDEKPRRRDVYGRNGAIRNNSFYIFGKFLASV